jgi:hypothetical protein
VSIAVTIDESGIMQKAFVGMGNVEKEFRTDTTFTDDRWDFVAVMPGGLTALRAGRIAIQISSPPLEPGLALTLGSALIDGMSEWPFSEGFTSGRDMPSNPVPCALLTQQEAEAVLGRLIVPPYASSKRTAIINNVGASCAYMTKRHRALVLTQTARQGAEFFRMKGGENITSLANGESGPGGWDSLSVGGDGQLHALKGDRVLSMQYVTSSTNMRGAVKLMRVAMTRF